MTIGIENPYLTFTLHSHLIYIWPWYLTFILYGPASFLNLHFAWRSFYLWPSLYLAFLLIFDLHFTWPSFYLWPSLYLVFLLSLTFTLHGLPSIFDFHYTWPSFYLWPSLYLAFLLSLTFTLSGLTFIFDLHISQVIPYIFWSKSPQYSCAVITSSLPH